VRKPDNLKGIIAIALLTLAGFACKSTSAPHTIKSKDGKYEFTVPGNMSESPGLNKDAQLTAASKADELYVFVLANKKSEYAAAQTLDHHTDILRKALVDELTEADATSPEKVTVNGNDARRYRVAGVRDGVKLAYFITIVETADHFHHIWAWTEGPRAGENGAILNQVANSFRVNQ
jgi:hypothetical protein